MPARKKPLTMEDLAAFADARDAELADVRDLVDRATMAMGDLNPDLEQINTLARYAAALGDLVSALLSHRQMTEMRDKTEARVRAALQAREA